MKIPPWLAHLRTDGRGRPVPYINRWGGEDVTRLAIRWDPNVRLPAVFLEDADQPAPDFLAQAFGRQRECMTQGRCQVCGRPVPWRHRRLVVAAATVEQVAVAGVGTRWVITEPWLHERCADFAVRVCPALIRRRRDEQLLVVTVTSPRDVSLAVSRGWVEGPLEAESQRVMPAMWVKAIVNHNIVTITEVPT
jgi:hypothetical protein